MNERLIALADACVDVIKTVGSPKEALKHFRSYIQTAYDLGVAKGEGKEPPSISRAETPKPKADVKPPQLAKQAPQSNQSSKTTQASKQAVKPPQGKPAIQGPSPKPVAKVEAAEPIPPEVSSKEDAEKAASEF